MPADPPSSPVLRASDADRDRVIEMRVCGGEVELVLAPGMVVDANELRVKHGVLAISPDAGDDTPETLHVRLVGKMKHGGISTRWVPPRL
jgi:hypothetical protein